LGPVFFPTQRRLGHRAVHTEPGPINAYQRVIIEQTFSPEQFKHTGVDPFLKAPVGRAGGADAGLVEGVPLAAGAQYEKDSVHGGPVGNPPSMTAQRMGLAGGKQRLDLLPEGVRDAPIPMDFVDLLGLLICQLAHQTCLLRKFVFLRSIGQYSLLG
jgi:hypothetical protein